MKSKIICIAVIVLMIFALNGCDSRRDVNMNININDYSLNSMDQFTANSMRQLITTEKNENYSPASLYFSLALAAEGSDGKTRDEFNSVLNIEKYDNLSDNMFDIIKKLEFKEYLRNTEKKERDNIKEDGEKARKIKEPQLAIRSSLWIDSKFNFSNDYKKVAARYYKADLYSVKMGSDLANKKMNIWVKHNTEGLVDIPVNTNQETVLTLINTIYYKDTWIRNFDKAENTHEDFYLSDESKVNVEYLNNKFNNKVYYKGANFSSVSLELENGGKMKFILPDDNVSLKDIINDSENIIGGIKTDVNEKVDVNVKLPKFTIKSKLKLKPILKSLGLRKAFEVDNNGLNNMTEAKDDVFISEIFQNNYLSVNENGIEAVAMTQEIMGKTSIDTEKRKEIDFYLNKPFMYIIEKDDVILFCGVVVNPAK